VTYYSLQKGPAAKQIESASERLTLFDFTPDLHDFADTAALISNLDLILGVDTAVVHLAGAMGKPVWIMLPAIPDWRWLLVREDSPWYPTAKLLRQKAPDDWAGVLSRIFPIPRSTRR
jgi:ADP-heptose:LPS heptosyltransferase